MGFQRQETIICYIYTAQEAKTEIIAPKTPYAVSYAEVNARKARGKSAIYKSKKTKIARLNDTKKQLET